MLLKKTGFPEEDSLVLVNVTKVNPNSVFVTLDHYGGRTGLIHISEISPGRIRNIRDYVVEGKKIVCKVLRVDKEKGHIDISLRRVTEIQKRNFLNDIKQEQKAEKLLEYIGKQLKKDLKTIYVEVGFKLIETYGGIYDAFQRFVLDEELIKDLKLEKGTEKLILEIVKDKIKAPEVEIKGSLKLISEEKNGVEIIKKILINAQKGDIKISYISAPNYSISVKASDYKTAEGILKNAQEAIITQIEKQKGHGEFKRE